MSRARELRRNLTDAERRLWQAIRDRQLGGAKFRRQAPLGPYFADFACYEAKLIVELDGGQHAELTSHDVVRQKFLTKGGFRVLRFWNNEVMENITGVLDSIRVALSE
jgi:very-short-patch-repair endonuclease